MCTCGERVVIDRVAVTVVHYGHECEAFSRLSAGKFIRLLDKTRARGSALGF